MKVDLREPWSYHRYVPSIKLEEADSFTQIGPSYAHAGLIDADTKSEQCGSYKQVAQGHSHTMSDSNLNLNPTQVNPEPTKPVVGFKPHQRLT